ncbi:MAG: RsmD family RNA methyltransferase [Bacteriovoracaceae bacterium]
MKNIWNYSQPNFYKFNEDSILLTKYLIENSVGKFDRALDLCAGCGVLGIELLSHNIISSCDFLEYQNNFLEHILHNLNLLEEPKLDTAIHIGSMSEFLASNRDKFYKKYDLIISNPPFFNIEDYKVSESNIDRNYCRFFIKDNQDIFFEFIANALKEKGECYFLFRGEIKSSKYNIKKVKELVGSSIFKFTLIH